MGLTRVQIKKTRTITTDEGRYNHRFIVTGGNGKLIVSSPPRQHYYNESDLEIAMVIAGKALVYNRREQIHNELLEVFRENSISEDEFNAMHKAMDLMFKHFKEA